MSQTPSSDGERPDSRFSAPDDTRNALSDAPQFTPPGSAGNGVTTPGVSSVAPPPGEPASDAFQPRYPILRLNQGISQQGLFDTEVVAIYRDHLLKGRLPRRIELTDGMCQETGEAELTRHLRQLRSIAFEDVTRLREKKPVSEKELRSQRQMIEFILSRKKGRSFRFSIPSTQVQDVRATLFKVVKGEYYVNAPIGGGCVTAVMLLVGLIAFLFAARAAATTQSPIALFGAVLSLVLFFGGAHFLRGQATFKKLTSLSPEAAPDGKQQETGSQRKSPFYSQGLGWTLKIMGIVYWILLVSDADELLFKPMEPLLGNNYQAIRTIWRLLLIPAALMIYAGYRMCQHRYDPQKDKDERSPILYLRPFNDDAMTTLQPSGALSWLLGVRDKIQIRRNRVAREENAGRVSILEMVIVANPVCLFRMVIGLGAGSSEETIAHYLRAYGPVRAIGRPGELLPTAGAARAYLSATTHKEWQELVRSELQRCRYVVLQPGTSPGVRWELEQIRSLNEPCKVLMCLVGYWQEPERYEELCRLVDSAFHTQMPRRVPFLNAPAFVYFDANWKPIVQEVRYKCPVLWPLTGEAADLPYTLQSFLKGKDAGEREQPLPSRWPWGARTALASLAAIVTGWGLPFVLYTTIEYAGHALFGSQASQQSAQSNGGLQAIAPMDSALQGTAPSNEASQPPAQPEQVSLGAAPPETPVTPPVTQLALPQKITLSGKAVPYHFTVPSTLETLKSAEETLEHSLQSPDKQLTIQVVAADDQEDISAIPAQRLAVNRKEMLAANKGKGSGQINMDSSRTISQAGVNWLEARISVNNVIKGADALEITRATSSARGTIYVIVTVVGFPHPDPVNLQLAEEILDSFTIE